MSKYKYEKEFMFSSRRLEEVELFLENEEGILDLPAILDNHKNTVLHHTAYHNQPRVFELYLKYYRKALEIAHFSPSEIKLQTRLFLDEANAEGYTAAHYTAYRGHVAVFRLLEKYGAHFGLTNHLQMTLLHLAAQGDKPCSFLFLHGKQLNINQRDSKRTTALHWAAFAGSEQIVAYLLSQPSIELDPLDNDGLTPLHLATIYGNSRIVRKLLVAGANRLLRSQKGQTALEIANSKEFGGVARMLTNSRSLLDQFKVVCNAKARY